MSRSQSTLTPFASTDVRHTVLRSGRRTIKYCLSFRDRSTLQIDVFPDLSVAVVTPLGTSNLTIDQAVKAKAPWIQKQLNEFQAFTPVLPQHKFISGECFRYLGRQYKLSIRKAETESIKMVRGKLLVATPDRDDRNRIQEIVESWYHEKASTVIAGLWKTRCNKVKSFGIQPKDYRLRKMKTRWGSCCKSGIIQLNPELVTESKSCIEYVIYHELCQLKHFNHGAEFFELLDVLCPDWKQLREKLNLNVRSSG